MHRFVNIISLENGKAITTIIACQVHSHRSEELSSMFAAPVTVAHEGGHFIPTDRETRQLYCRFLQNIMGSLMADGNLVGGESSLALSPDNDLNLHLVSADEERTPVSERHGDSENGRISPSESTHGVHGIAANQE
jgi:hypothetical protein